MWTTAVSCPFQASVSSLYFQDLSAPFDAPRCIGTSVTVVKEKPSVNDLANPLSDEPETKTSFEL